MAIDKVKDQIQKKKLMPYETRDLEEIIENLEILKLKAKF